MRSVLKSIFALQAQIDCDDYDDDNDDEYIYNRDTDSEGDSFDEDEPYMWPERFAHTRSVYM